MKSSSSGSFRVPYIPHTDAERQTMLREIGVRVGGISALIVEVRWTAPGD
jgi:hypothetical protein